MKSSNKIMIYDDSCPLCEAYTAAFIKTGLLEKEGRQSFSAVDVNLLSRVDASRCRDEIPLVDVHTGKVLYGIDALLEVLNTRLPLIKRVAALIPVNWFIRKLYKLISYNRRVIVAAAKTQTGFDCTPHFNILYRLIFIMIGLAFNTLMLFPIQDYVLKSSLLQNVSAQQLQISHALLVAANVMLSLFLAKERALEYLGQVNMLALCSILLMVPIIFLNRYLLITAAQNNVLIGGLILFIVKEYRRRMKFAKIYPRYKAIIFANFFCLVVFITYLIW